LGLLRQPEKDRDKDHNDDGVVQKRGKRGHHDTEQQEASHRSAQGSGSRPAADLLHRSGLRESESQDEHGGHGDRGGTAETGEGLLGVQDTSEQKDHRDRQGDLIDRVALGDKQEERDP